MDVGNSMGVLTTKRKSDLRETDTALRGPIQNVTGKSEVRTGNSGKKYTCRSLRFQYLPGLLACSHRYEESK